MPIITSLRLFQSITKIIYIEDVNENIRSPFEFLQRRPLWASNRFAKIYITFLEGRREAIQRWKNESRQENALELLDSLDLEILKYLSGYTSPASPMAHLALNLIKDLLNLRQLQGLPRYPQG